MGEASVRWNELCMDTAEDSPRLGEFWAAVIGGELRSSDADPAGDVVVPGLEGGGIAMCPVPEAKTVKHRVHIDVHTAAIADLEALGATVVLPSEESGFGWTVMVDPEGGEFCAFVREPSALPAYRLYEVGIDSADPRSIAQWWGERFGVEADFDDAHGWASLGDVPDMPFDGIVFARVPEPKTVKNRVHWDVYGDPGELAAAGATHLWDQPRWTTMADPEGNEFCVFPEG